MRVAFYVGKGNLVDKAIRLLTKSKYSHCELVFDTGEWAAADAWENKVRIKKEEAFNPANWEFVDLPWCRESCVKASLEPYLGLHYDFVAVLGWVAMADASKKIYCSELIAKIFDFEINGHISPGELYIRLKERLAGREGLPCFTPVR